MRIKRTIAVVYASIHHGNTQKLAELLSTELSADLFSVDQIRTDSVNLDRYDLVGFGSGIYFGRHHASLLRLIESCSQSPRRVFIFSTAGLPFLRWFQHLPLRRRLVSKGCRIVSEFCCRGWDTVGPLWLIGGINRKHPDATDLNRAKEFARQTIASLEIS
jgi:flavodoxin